VLARDPVALEFDHAHHGNLDPPAGRRDAGQEPVHVDGVVALEDQLVDDPILTMVRESSSIAVSGGIFGMKRVA
jgi:hypothetical protein